MKKYEFTGATMEYKGHTLRQIRAVRDFGSIEKGTDGGWLEKEENLSHDGNCWVYPYASVYENAFVTNHAIIRDNAEVHGDATICDEAQIGGIAEVCGDAYIAGYTKVCESARINGASMEGCTRVLGSAYIRDVTIPSDCTIRSKITSDKDFLVLNTWWTGHDALVWTRVDNMWSAFDFFGEAKDLLAKCGTSPEKRREIEATIKYVESLLAVRYEE